MSLKKCVFFSVPIELTFLLLPQFLFKVWFPLKPLVMFISISELLFFSYMCLMIANDILYLTIHFAMF